MHGGNTPPGVCDVIERSGELDIDRTLRQRARAQGHLLYYVSSNVRSTTRQSSPSIHTCGGLGQMSVDAARLC